VEIITRGECRRSWTLEQKREIVAESLGSELTPTEVARKHAISSGQLYTLRQQLLSKPGAVIERRLPRFAEVIGLIGCSRTSSDRRPYAAWTADAGARAAGVIEIMLPGGVSLCVDIAVDGGAHRRVLDALGRR
jgi:transposase